MEARCGRRKSDVRIVPTDPLGTRGIALLSTVRLIATSSSISIIYELGLGPEFLNVRVHTTAAPTAVEVHRLVVVGTDSDIPT
jgi:hypothetical protein